MFRSLCVHGCNICEIWLRKRVLLLASDDKECVVKSASHSETEMTLTSHWLHSVVSAKEFPSGNFQLFQDTWTIHPELHCPQSCCLESKEANFKLGDIGVHLKHNYKRYCFLQTDFISALIKKKQRDLSYTTEEESRLKSTVPDRVQHELFQMSLPYWRLVE